MIFTSQQIFFSVLVFLIVAYFIGSAMTKMRKRFARASSETSLGIPKLPDGLPKAHPVGWVYITQQDIKQGLGDAGHAGTSLGMIPLFVRSFFCELTLSDVYDVVMLKSFPEHNHVDWDHIKRGLTIGSALFNYPIPRSFVLVDVETASYYQIFMTSQIRKLNTQQWLESNDAYEGWLNNALTAAEMAMGLTAEETVKFFNAHHEKIVDEIHRQTKSGLFPVCDAFTKNVLVQLTLNYADERQQHYFRVALAIILDLGEMVFPMDWMLTSNLTLGAKVLITGSTTAATEPTPPNKPSPLTLVVNK